MKKEFPKEGIKIKGGLLKGSKITSITSLQIPGKCGHCERKPKMKGSIWCKDCSKEVRESMKQHFGRSKK